MDTGKKKCNSLVKGKVGFVPSHNTLLTLTSSSGVNNEISKCFCQR